MIKKLFVILLSLVLISGTVVFAQEVINQGTQEPEINVTQEQAQLLNETLEEEPPLWVQAMQAEKLAWQAQDLEGPPPWAKGKAKSEEKMLWRENEGENEGPPPWASAIAKSPEKEAWRANEGNNEGPPPWANGRATSEQKEAWRATEGENEGPPPWASDKTDKTLKQAMRENQGEDNGPPSWAPAKGRNK